MNTTSRPPALVVGLDSITGLQTARILKARGLHVTATASDRRHFACRTNAIDKLLSIDDNALIDTLIEYRGDLDGPSVLIPCSDSAVRLISEARGRLAGAYHFALPDAAVVDALMDKATFAVQARRAGLSVPEMAVVRDTTNAKRAAETLRFPCVAKPALRNRAWDRLAGDKVVEVPTPAAWLALHERCRDLDVPVVLQEWIPGPDANLYSCNCVFSSDGEPLVTFVARKLRQWPPQRGTSTLGEEVRCDQVLKATLRLFFTVPYRGLGYLEMKRDERTGELFAIEANIGRPTGRSAIAEAGGVELVYTAYCDAAGLPVPPGQIQRYKGVKWVHLRRDLQSALHYHRNGQLTVREWWRSLSGPKTMAVFSWRDPAPFVGDMSAALGKVGSSQPAAASSDRTTSQGPRRRIADFVHARALGSGG